MGEQRDLAAPFPPWTNGSYPVAQPAPRRIGSAPCLESGETYPPFTDGRTLIHGIDSRCWDVQPETQEGGVMIGGEADDHLAESAEGGVRVGGETTALPGEDAEGGVRVGGETSQAPDPGADCDHAGMGALGETIAQTGRPAGSDWYSFPADSGGDYHLDLTWTFGKGSVFVYYGTCAGLTTIGLHGASGCYSYAGVPAGTTIFVRCLITYLLGTDYSFAVNEGSCP